MSTKTKKTKKGQKTKKEGLSFPEENKQTAFHGLKDKLIEDERSSVLLQKKLDKDWRTVFHHSQKEEQRRQIDVLKGTWEAQLHGMDSCIMDMIEELRQKKQWFGQLRQCHLMNLCKLREMQKKHTALFQEEWERSKTELRKCYRRKSEPRSLDKMFQTLNLEDTAPDIQDPFDESLRHTVSCFDSIIYVIEKNFQQKRQKFLEKYEEILWEYKIKMQENTKELQRFTEQNECERNALDMKKNKIGYVKRELAALQTSQTEVAISVANVQEQLAGAEKQNQKVRAMADLCRTILRKRLTDVTVQSDKAASNLKSVIEKAERVLRFVVLCKKMEDKQLSAEELQEICVWNPNFCHQVEEENFDFPQLSVMTYVQNVAMERCCVLQRQQNTLLYWNELLWKQKQHFLQPHLHVQVITTYPKEEAGKEEAKV